MCAFGGVGAYFERLPACDSVYARACGALDSVCDEPCSNQHAETTAL